MRVTEADRAILRTLAGYPDAVSSGRVAATRGIRTSSPSETAARHLIKLTKMGLATKHGSRMWPLWRITDAGRKALSDPNKESAS